MKLRTGGPPLYGVLCPDWMKCAGIPEQLFSLSLHEAAGGETHLTDKTLYNSDDCWIIELFNTHFYQTLVVYYP